MRVLALFAFVLSAAAFSAAHAVEAPFTAPKGSVHFQSPKNGATVTSPVKVIMIARHIKLRPAGQDPNDHKTGHHHIIIDGGPVPEGQVIPTDATHLHFGKAQVEAEIKLTPGPHTLTLQLADGAHRSYGPKLSDTIKITVK